MDMEERERENESVSASGHILEIKSLVLTSFE